MQQANLAQLVEHFIRNERVVGSIPIVGSAEKKGDTFLSITQEYFDQINIRFFYFICA